MKIMISKNKNTKIKARGNRDRGEKKETSGIHVAALSQYMELRESKHQFKRDV